MDRYRTVYLAGEPCGTWVVEHSQAGGRFEVLVEGYATEAEALRHILVAARLQKHAASGAAVRRTGQVAGVLPFAAGATARAARL